jgi:hypothetical protein
MEEGPKRLPVAKIIQDLQQQISQNPEMKNQQEVKNLFIDFSMYKREHENFAKLSPNISDDRAPTFFSNFKEKIDAIVDDINRSYHKIITEEERENPAGERKTVKRVPLPVRAAFSDPAFPFSGADPYPGDLGCGSPRGVPVSGNPC